jgi:hypothetical protein
MTLIQLIVCTRNKRMLRENLQGGGDGFGIANHGISADQSEKVFMENLTLVERANDEVISGINELIKTLEEQGSSTVSDRAISEMQKIKVRVQTLHELANSKFQKYQIPFELIQ